MRSALGALACVFVFSMLAVAKERPVPARKRPGKASPAKPSVDWAKGAVDPYDPAGERGKFFAAAGVDNELDAKEFAAARGKKDSFVRPFDRWESLRLYDKDGKGSIDWFEADAYRRALRQRVLKAFDADKNARLTDAERDKANAALASGRLPGDPAANRRGGSGSPHRNGGRHDAGSHEKRRRPEGKTRGGRDKRTPDATPSAEDMQARAQALRQQSLKKRYDKDGDGKLSDTERAAMAAAQTEWDRRTREARAQAEQRRKEQTARYDTDGDGQLNDTERQAMVQAFRQQSLTKRYDKNGDGKLSDTERAAMAAAQAEWDRRTREARAQAEQRRKEQTARYDTDGDGQLNDTERKAMQEGLRRQWKKRSEEMRQRSETLRKQADADGDGTTSGQEWRDFWTKTRTKYDTNGDGRLNTDERQKMMRELYGDAYGQGGIRVVPGRAATVVGAGGASVNGQTTWTTKNGKATVILRH